MKTTLVALGATLGLLAAACSGGGSVDTGVASLSDSAGDVISLEGIPDVDREAALLEFTACIRDQGVAIADPTVDAEGNVRLSRPAEGFDEAQRTALDAARVECDYALEGVTLGFSGEDATEREDQFLAYAACMRDNGYDMPDPDFSNFGTPGGGGQRGIFGDIDREDPDFLAAQDVCALDLPGGGPGQGSN